MLSDTRVGVVYTCGVEAGYSGAVVGYGLVLVCGAQLVLCVCWVEGKCGDTVVGDVEVLPVQLVCVGKLGCFTFSVWEL